MTNQIFPVWTYSYLAVLLPVFLLTDWLRYKPVIVLQCCALFLTTAMLLWLQSIRAMQAVQFVYSMVTACEVAYFSYIYSVVDLQFYPKATSFCRAAQLMGYTAGAVAGQILLSLRVMSYYYILVFTLVLISISFTALLLLPMPSTSMFFHQRKQYNRGRGSNQVEDFGGTEKIVNTGRVETDLNSGSADKEMMENRQQNSRENLQGESGADVEKSGEALGHASPL